MHDINLDGAQMGSPNMNNMHIIRTSTGTKDDPMLVNGVLDRSNNAAPIREMRRFAITIIDHIDLQFNAAIDRPH